MNQSNNTHTEHQAYNNQNMHTLKQIEILQKEIHHLKQTRLIIGILVVLFFFPIGILIFLLPAVNKSRQIYELEQRISMLYGNGHAHVHNAYKKEASTTNN